VGASLEQLAGLPPALVITAEAEVLRDKGGGRPSYQHLLRSAALFLAQRTAHRG